MFTSYQSSHKVTQFFKNKFPLRLPVKHSLAHETKTIIHEAILSGDWKTHLPGERLLCERFQISRPTLRLALRKLEDEGVLANSHGKRRKIVNQPRKTISRIGKPVIGYLSPTPLKEMFGHTSRKFSAIEYHIHQMEIGFRLHVRPGCYSQTPANALRVLVEETQVRYWILQNTNLPMQLWFQRNHYPAVITGSRHDGVALPFVDLDNIAVLRHAVGLLASRGRKRIFYLTTSTPQPGDLHSDEGFLQGIKAGKNISGKIVRTHNSPEVVSSKVAMMLERQPYPDAFIVDKASHAFSVVSGLLRRGLRIPEDISVVCRTESRDFQYMTPSIAHYSTNTEEVAKRTSEIAIRLSMGEPVDNVGSLIIPDFVSGQSL